MSNGAARLFVGPLWLVLKGSQRGGGGADALTALTMASSKHPSSRAKVSSCCALKKNQVSKRVAILNGFVSKLGGSKTPHVFHVQQPSNSSYPPKIEAQIKVGLQHPPGVVHLHPKWLTQKHCRYKWTTLKKCWLVQFGWKGARVDHGEGSSFRLTAASWPC